ncbi:hypothetical protein TVAG_173640 [Trichomonas vaginalis G3]|uniref:Uncharacterized protein n=1 Tax=Trichomonas vaginalis (strain ATCC PRA-98 / G3) TaxID=412133 RepID=A2EVI7_TRIV3|nr:cation-transporting ATPase-related family [Trichomonas vaginalis G3]EAY03319.1 hypothetical protein TVAG_173640 [Trichomonas vaginalis G3]KAI5498342.1 cation-transporting ATPase-related family [Trichomonas vaginalis G3]|eukprot:XP_001315542.1 hypothetical protein [Trichomonas vaginalis G3]
MPLEYNFVTKKPLFSRLDIVPFVIIYSLIFYPAYTLIDKHWIYEEPDNPSNSSFAFIFDHVDAKALEPHAFIVLLPVFVVLIHTIFLILSYWLPKWNEYLHYDKATEKTATHVAFHPDPHKGLPGIVEYVRGKPSYVYFQQKKREYKDCQFVSLQYPTKLQIQDYLGAKGLSSAEATKREEYYGLNQYKLPIPSMSTLLFENLKSPFIFFQFFNCIILLLDEYFTTPLVYMAQLIFMEYSNIKTFHANYTDLRGADLVPIAVNVYRDRKWKKMLSDKIVPGDLVLIPNEINAPCDLVILKGRAVVNEAMLTGESTPQLKDTVDGLPLDTTLNTEKHRRHIIFGGTRIEQIISAKDKTLPEEGTLCYAISTGFGSAQGRLLRTIMFGSQYDQTKFRDSYKILGLLSSVSVIATLYYYFSAKTDSDSTIFRLIVNSLMIFTKAAPPDLQTSISMQINTSVNSLAKLDIYTTEPYRIQLAGGITTCCFDKTGTLTSEEYKLVGVDTLNAPAAPKNKTIKGNYFSSPSEMPVESMWVVGGCHSLIRGKYGKLIGDSLESAAFQQMHFKLNSDKSATYGDISITPIKEYHFSSELKRMTVVCNVSGRTQPIAVIKGAPEAVQPLLTTVPSDYKQAYLKYARQGCRVLVLGYRILEFNYDPSTAKRDDIEKNFIFAGFAIFDAPLKRGSEDTVVELLKSQHRVIIITGDAALTAAHVAKRLHMFDRHLEIHDYSDGQFETIDEFGNVLETTSNEDRELVYTGSALEHLSEEDFASVVSKCNIFSRMSPQQKLRIIITLNKLGHVTLMCGDGTNDVGAIKNAHVGVGLISDDDKSESKQNQQQQTQTQPQNQNQQNNNENNQNNNTQNSMEKMMTDFSSQMGYRSSLGAASIAAPFVSKRGTVTAVIDIIRFGRATLTSTTDMFKQCAIKVVLECYHLTILNLENVRASDHLLTFSGIITSLVSISMAWAKPRRQLSSLRPIPGQFNIYLLSSIFIQWFVHLVILHLTHSLVFAVGYKHDTLNTRSKFEPTLLNTAIYLVYTTMDTMSFCCNYTGAPFMQSFSENKSLIFGFMATILLNIICMFNVFPGLNKWLQLAEFPTFKFQLQLILLCLIDVAFCFVFEKILLWYFLKKSNEKNSHLVSQTVVDSLDTYVTNDDDLMPSEYYKFGFSEMMSSMLSAQVKTQQLNRQQSVRDRQRKEYESKLEEEIKKQK